MQKADLELLNQYFSSVFRSPSSLVNNIPLQSDMEISEVEVSVDEMKKCLDALDTSKVQGPDGIPALLLKECSEQIAPLTKGKGMEIGRHNTYSQKELKRTC